MRDVSAAREVGRGEARSEELRALSVRELLQRLAASEACLHPAWGGEPAVRTDEAIRVRNAALRSQARIVRELRRRKNVGLVLGDRDRGAWWAQRRP
ncbi:hypothetical protein BN12_40033 [Nostocoides japonicum T1-X7]|uniref:Uncharacterized protein n=1 Tax=Nostocoides japonicum T1-X7 TaxID=1194083 RepID=A0A077LYS5_9MICO|nr:hypothetical protein [Tetrasphaera japonica]CCH79063.1 hypothetical protein BN12_40033 [Tetrasphaera japonica T1-X7]